MQGEGTQSRALREELARRTGTSAEDWFLTFQARSAMQVAFEETRSMAGDGSVVTQLATCCTAVDPILEAGLASSYADISARSLSVDPDALLLPADVRAVVVQHTFGIVDDHESARLAGLAHEAGAVVVEDCAHCVGRMARDAGGKPVADVSVHSFGVEKMLPTQFGGAIWVNPGMGQEGLAKALRDRLVRLPVMGQRMGQAVRDYRDRTRVLNHLPRPLARRLRAIWTARGAYVPGVSEEEMRGRVARPPMAPDEWVCSQALEALSSLDGLEARKRAACAAYARALGTSAEGVAVPTDALEADEPQPLLFFPVALGSSEAAEDALGACRRRGLYAVRWYDPLLFPGVRDLAAYGFDGNLAPFPQLRRLTVGPVGLPTDVPEEVAADLVADLGLASA